MASRHYSFVRTCLWPIRCITCNDAQTSMERTRWLSDQNAGMAQNWQMSNGLTCLSMVARVSVLAVSHPSLHPGAHLTDQLL